MTKINSFNFGFIVIDGKQYTYDVLILPDGTVKEREPSKRRLGSHAIRKSEIEYISKAPSDVILIGTGTSGLAKLSQNAEVYLQQPDLNLVVVPSPQAVEKFNQFIDEGKRVAALIHITC